MRSWKIGVAATVVIAAAVVTTVVLRDNSSDGSAGAAPNPAMMAMPVPVSKIVRKSVPIYLDYSARTDSIRSISLQAKVAGYIQHQHVPDGSDVKEGDLLYTIDPREYQAALDQAKAQVQRDEAALTYARSNFDRGTSLAKSGFLAKDTFDQRNSAVAQGEAALAMSQAAVKTAELNLGYAEIRAPFNGRLGRNQASVGTLITVGGAPLNSLADGANKAPGYTLFNIRGELNHIANTNLDFAVGVNNVGNKAYVIGGGGIWQFGTNAVVYGPPRMFYAEVKFRF